MRPKRPLPAKSSEMRVDCVILGRPNAGKSVLLNSLIETKVAATNRKRHTTRGEILGVYNRRNTQIAFYDTPGYVFGQDAQSNEMKALRSISIAAVKKADVVILCVDAAINRLSDHQQDSFVEMVKVAFQNAKMEVILVLNKVDIVKPKTKLLETTRQLVSLINGVKYAEEEAENAELDTTTFMVSALHDDGTKDLREYLAGLASKKAWILPRLSFPHLSSSPLDSGGDNGDLEDDGDDEEREEELEANAPLIPSRRNVTSLTPKQRVDEIILEKLLSETHEEIPYIADIRTKTIRRLNPTRLRIDVDIHVDTGAQQRIVIGHQARTLLAIRQKSCRVLEQVFGRDIILMLWVKTRMKKGARRKGGYLAHETEEDDREGDDEYDDNDDDEGDAGQIAGTVLSDDELKKLL
jgi:GTP-binding protein Era